MSDQAYSSVPTKPLTASQDPKNPVEPDQTPNDTTTAADVGKKELTDELGGTGTTIIKGFLTNQDYNAELTGTKRIQIYDEMRLSDATARAGLNAVKLALLSADWYIKDPKGEDDKKSPQAEFIEEQLFRSKTFSWTSFLRQALTMCEYGNAIFEKVFEQLPDGKIGWKRFAPRLSKTIYRWTMNDGKTPGIYQILPTGGNAEIPRWKLLYFINEQEGSNYEGISLLRACYKNYYYKELYYKIDSIASEKQGVGIPKIIRPPNAQPQDIAKVREIARNLRANEQAYAELPQGWDLSYIDMKANELKNTKEMIEHHDRQIAKAFLAQFLDLGSKAGGSYALSQDQSKLFLLGLEYLAKLIQEEMNKAIRELCDMNFANLKDDEYPLLDYGAIGQIDYTALSDSLQKLTSSQLLTPTPELEKYVRASWKLPELDESDLVDLEQDDVPAPDKKKPLADTKAKLPNKQIQPTTPKKEKNIQATEVLDDMAAFEEDVVSFAEELHQVISEKRKHAPGN